MKGLLLQDFYSIRRYGIIILPFLVWLGLVNALLYYPDFPLIYKSAIYTFFMIIFGMIPSILYSNSDKDKWLDYSMTTAVSGKDIISSKYLLQTALNTLNALLLIIITLYSDSDIDTKLFCLATSVGILFLISSVIMPLTVIFSNKYQIITIITAFGLTDFLFAIYFYVASILKISVIKLISVPIIILAIITYIVSWKLSIHLFEKDWHKIKIPIIYFVCIFLLSQILFLIPHDNNARENYLYNSQEPCPDTGNFYCEELQMGIDFSKLGSETGYLYDENKEIQHLLVNIPFNGNTITILPEDGFSSDNITIYLRGTYKWRDDTFYIESDYSTVFHNQTYAFVKKD